MARLAWLMGLLVLAGCGASVTVSSADAGAVDVPAVAPADVGAAVDVGVAVDVPIRDVPVTSGECARPSDCAGPVAPPSSSWCSGMSSWSCIDRQCVWECRGGRTCERAPDGCVQCDDAMRDYCPGRDRCPPGWPDAVQVEEAFCARAWTREPSQCFGPWVRMNDGTLCSLQSLFTGAPRSVLACRRCQTTILNVEPQS